MPHSKDKTSSIVPMKPVSDTLVPSPSAMPENLPLDTLVTEKGLKAKPEEKDEAKQTDIIIAPPRKKKKDNDMDEYEEKKKEGKIAESLVLTTWSENGKVVGYSIGLDGPGKEVRDVSNLNLTHGDLLKEIHQAMEAAAEDEEVDDILLAAKNAVEAKYPGQKTYSVEAFEKEFWGGEFNLNELPRPE